MTFIATDYYETGGENMGGAWAIILAAIAGATAAVIIIAAVNAWR